MSRITITGVGAVTKQGKFFYVPIAYTDKGKPFEKKVMDFANKEIYAIMKQAKVGEEYEISIAKDNNGYWQWTEAIKAEAGSAAAGTNSATTVRGTYETPEERAAKQVYIARQSSLAQAVAYLDGEAGVDDVLEMAEKFADWVMRPTKEVDG